MDSGTRTTMLMFLAALAIGLGSASRAYAVAPGAFGFSPAQEAEKGDAAEAEDEPDEEPSEDADTPVASEQPEEPQEASEPTSPQVKEPEEAPSEVEASSDRDVRARASADGGPAQTGSFHDGFAAGTQAAEQESVSSWWWGSFGASCLFSATGCAAVSAIAYGVSPGGPPGEAFDPGRSPNWRNGYRKGYEERLKKRRLNAALVGGLIGAGIPLVAVVAIYVVYGLAYAATVPEDGNYPLRSQLRFEGAAISPGGLQLNF